jgi:hypothetical protein
MSAPCSPLVEVSDGMYPSVQPDGSWWIPQLGTQRLDRTVVGYERSSPSEAR